LGDGISCDRCGRSLLVEEKVRYVCEVKVYAAYDPLELTAQDLAGDKQAEIAELLSVIEKADPEELMDEVARTFKLDLCPPCQRELLRWLRARPGGAP
jgi:hypothetical protein